MAFKFKTKPYAHQLKALRQGADAESFAYLMEMGTGKSKVTIDNIHYLFDQGLINAAVIVAPKGVYSNWTTKEIPYHFPEPARLYVYNWCTNQTKKELAKQSEMLNLSVPDKLKVLCINVESFSSARGTDFVRKFLRAHQCMMVVDESTTIKNLKAGRTQSLVQLGGLAKYRRILTGSPITNSPLDIFSQAQFLDPKLLGFTSFYAFRARYAKLQRIELGLRSFIKVTGYQRLDELNEKLSEFSFRITKDECLDLPEKIYMRREVELTTEQKKAYEQMKNLAMVTLANDRGVSSAQIALTQILRLHQIVCGHLPLDGGGEPVPLPNNRLNALLELLDECAGKVIIWANYKPNIRGIVARLSEEYGPETVVEFHGDVSTFEREAANLAFQDLEKIEGGVRKKVSQVRFFVGNTQTGGMGIDLFNASHMIFYSNNYKLEDRIQAESRAHRNGLQHKLTIHDLVAPDTVDEKIIKALREKRNIAQLITGDSFTEWI